MTDYLEAKFPNYILTEDTSVVPYKNYFRKEGSCFIRIIEPDGNPSHQGLYEFRNNHNDEYRFHIDSLQINNISAVCQEAMATLARYPKWTLPRQTEMEGGIIIDWSTSFFDTVWNENIGCIPIHKYAVSFATAMFLANNLNVIVSSITGSDSSFWNLMQTAITTFSTVSNEGPNYSSVGYSLDPNTLGNTDRIDDVFTCIHRWSFIDYRVCKMIIEDLKRMDLSTTQKETVNSFLNIMDRTARTIADLCKRIQYTEVQYASPKTRKMVTVPAVITVNGTTYYRVEFTNQLVNGGIYGEARVDRFGGVGVFWIRQIISDDPIAHPPAYPINSDDLIAYAAGMTVIEKEVPYFDVQHGKVIYTTVPFEGI